MLAHEITPKQLRALLLLLVLVPLIPTVLMVRFVIDAVRNERETAIERIRGIHQQTLLKAEAPFVRHHSNPADPVTPESVRRYYQDFFDDSVRVLITDGAGRVLAGDVSPRSIITGQVSVRDVAPWNVQLWLVDQRGLRAAIKEQVKGYAWTVVIAVIAVFSIAAAAGVTVSRQLALRELKSTSVATVAHELRTPLASMRMLVDTLREGRYRGEEQLREYLDLIARENMRLNRLTDNFLTLSRLEHKQQPFSLAPAAPRELVEGAVEAMRAKLHLPGVHFTLQIPDALPEVYVDREAMLTVLTNLLDNALKYTETEKEISLRVRHQRGHVIFSVEDNGIGLSREERRRIFEPFYQSDQKLSRVREGCGLGLSIVHHIIHAHRGEITVTSESSKGSAFHVHLPAASNRLT